jgi:hypothetical protein
MRRWSTFFYLIICSLLCQKTTGLLGPTSGWRLLVETSPKIRAAAVVRLASSCSESDGKDSPKLLLPSKREIKRERKRKACVEKRQLARLEAKYPPRATGGAAEAKDCGPGTETAIARRLRAADANAAWLAKARLGPTLVIDCSWEAGMTRREVRSLVQQIKLCYGANRASPRPAQLVLASVSGETLRGLALLSGWGRWFAVHATSAPLECLLNQGASEVSSERSGEPVSLPLNANSVPTSRDELADFRDAQELATTQTPQLPVARVVYLTADSSCDLCPHDEPLPWRPEDTYVVGGIVKGAGLRRATVARADALGLRTARLPLCRFLAVARSVPRAETLTEALKVEVAEDDYDTALRHNDGLSEGSRGTVPVVSTGLLSGVEPLVVTEGFPLTFTVNRVCEVLLLKAASDGFVAACDGSDKTLNDGGSLSDGGWASALASVIPLRYRP